MEFMIRLSILVTYEGIKLGGMYYFIQKGYLKIQ